MLKPRGGAGDLGKAHGDAREDQAFGDSCHGLGIALHQSFGHAPAFVDRGAHKAGDVLAVVFTGDQMGYPPLAYRDILGQHIAQACHQHLKRRVLHDIRIADDGLRAGNIEGDLDVALDHGRGVGRVAVHRRGGRHDQLRQFRRMGQHLAAIVDHTAAYGDDTVAGGIKAHGESADGVLIRLHFQRGGFKNKQAVLGPGLIERFLHLLACRLIGILVKYNKGTADRQLFKSFGQMADSARLYSDIF